MPRAEVVPSQSSVMTHIGYVARSLDAYHNQTVRLKLFANCLHVLGDVVEDYPEIAQALEECIASVETNIFQLEKVQSEETAERYENDEDEL